MEAGSFPATGTSWGQRFWMPRTAAAGSTQTRDNNSYLQSDDGSTVLPEPVKFERSRSSFTRVASWFLRDRQRPSDDTSTVADFDETEWTPPDSSYGAAIPVAGWIPKEIRRLIEWTFLAMLVGAVVYLLITISMLRGHNGDEGENSAKAYDKSSSSYSSGGGLYLDDDRYIAYDSAARYSSNASNSSSSSNTTTSGNNDQAVGDDGSSNAASMSNYYNAAYDDHDDYFRRP
jgi:hypothetical protein